MYKALFTATIMFGVSSVFGEVASFNINSSHSHHHHHHHDSCSQGDDTTGPTAGQTSSGVFAGSTFTPTSSPIGFLFNDLHTDGGVRLDPGHFIIDLPGPGEYLFTLSGIANTLPEMDTVIVGDIHGNILAQFPPWVTTSYATNSVLSSVVVPVPPGVTSVVVVDYPISVGSPNFNVGPTGGDFVLRVN